MGEWFAARGNREQVVLTTKFGGLAPFDNHQQDTVIAALDASLQRLQTDYVDVVYSHYDDENAPECMRTWFEYATTNHLAVPAAIKPQYNLATEEGLALVDELVRVAEARGAEPATVALSWQLAKGVTAPIASAFRAEQFPAPWISSGVYRSSATSSWNRRCCHRSRPRAGCAARHHDGLDN